MPKRGKGKKKQAGEAALMCCCWTVEDEKALIAFMATHKAETGDGYNFKDTTFHAAARDLSQYPHEGVPKTWKSCQDKWHSVSELL